MSYEASITLNCEDFWLFINMCGNKIAEKAVKN